MIDRLSSYQSSPDFKTTWLSQWGARRTLYSFLAARCSKPFLALYLKKFPGLLDAVASPGLYLSWAPEVALCCRLFELGLLPEEIRRSEEHTSELQSLMRSSYAVFCLKQKRRAHVRNTVQI